MVASLKDLVFHRVPNPSAVAFPGSPFAFCVVSTTSDVVQTPQNYGTADSLPSLPRAHADVSSGRRALGSHVGAPSLLRWMGRPLGPHPGSG